MRAVIQRVSAAHVTVEGRTTGTVERGFVVLLGVAAGDDARDAQTMADKIVHLRIFNDDAGLMNRSIVEVSGDVLLISQFTLHGDVRKGRRPSFIAAAREDVAKPLYELVGRELEREGIRVGYGVFGAHMDVHLINDGPVTILIDTKKAF